MTRSSTLTNCRTSTREEVIRRAVLKYLQKYDSRSTRELRSLLFHDGLCCHTFSWCNSGQPVDPAKVSGNSANRYISRMRTSGLLYYDHKPGNRLRMTLAGEAMLASILREEEGE